MALTRKTVGRARSQFKETGSNPISNVFKDFLTDQIALMKKELEPRRSTGSLASSITFKIGTNEKGFSAEVLANDYWDFINSGVNGLAKNHGSAYSFRSAFPGTKMIDAFTGTGSMRGWMATKGITSLNWTDKQGELVTKELTTEKDFRSAAYVLARAVKLKGIEKTAFVDNVFNDKAIERLQEDIFKALDKMLE